jgi:hypothetical protein
LRHDADDGGGRSVDTNRAADGGRVRAESLDPDAVSDDDDGVGARSIVVRPEIPPRDRALAQSAERIGGDEAAGEVIDWMPVNSEIHAGAGERREAGEGAQSAAPVEEIQV